MKGSPRIRVRLMEALPDFANPFIPTSKAGGQYLGILGNKVGMFSENSCKENIFLVEQAMCPPGGKDEVNRKGHPLCSWVALHRQRSYHT